MNTTRMPGFKAEASIYRSCAHDSGDPTSALRKGDEGVVRPALWMDTFCERWGSVRMCCWVVWDGGHFCFESPFLFNGTFPFLITKMGPFYER